MTYPLIGNYGITDEDYETKFPTIGGMVMRECNDSPSNFRYTKTLDEVLEELDIPGISGVDTRMITRIIRNEGCQKANQKGCNVTIVPYDSTPEEIMAFNPDGIFLSNGPGDPEDVKAVRSTIEALRVRLPIFGICLGHQLIALSYGARTFKMKFGHRGGNHPVKNLDTGRIEITSQNHNYAVDEESLRSTPLRVTHVNLLDSTVEGMESAADKIFSIQYHPESAPGPQDSSYLFDKFIKMMEDNRDA